MTFKKGRVYIINDVLIRFSGINEASINMGGYYKTIRIWTFDSEYGEMRFDELLIKTITPATKLQRLVHGIDND